MFKKRKYFYKFTPFYKQILILAIIYRTCERFLHFNQYYSMIEQHINEEELRKKITGLFEYRFFPTLMASADDTPDNISIFNENLIELQEAIYYLDAHLEGNWQTDQRILQWHWKNIESKLLNFNLAEIETGPYLNHIRKYEKHELELRDGKTPLRLDMEYFYFYKSCDVKLLRRLIYEKYKLSPQWGNLADWRYYDLVTEVNDDVEDLSEDLSFINGNRFLISIILKGKTETKRVFDDFLKQILAKSLDKYHLHQHEWLRELHHMTEVQVKTTKSLIDQQIDSISMATLKDSRLMLCLHQNTADKISHQKYN